MLRRLVPLAAALLALALAVSGAAAAPRASAPPGWSHDARPRSEIGFRSRERLDDHYRRHGREVGASSPGEYVRIAQQLRDRSVGGTILELPRRDGSFARFDRASGIFLACARDGTILTCFRPRQGEEYFRRQARRRW